ncbi:type IX secretion system ring subunit PorN/GldN [Solitalea canadensis]|uniref:Gliding motility associated protein GldN n=1 Tax=Solitalea canadensis (strain ATCC 29591 / DSM 3403 / JCM 21819 / LMG 8368 / NBRC 15130 / NCIMB 12057 / USAM 9D) TaxID=929556 RepID=H8KWZ8_SOLCM|nr:gliding motility protein GldN [Solitalea canadensis]AFD08327.1 gliding motility associated protein GldN [Solitalea canadensis DSM 3403]
MKRFYLVALALLLSCTVVLGQAKKKKSTGTKAKSTKTAVAKKTTAKKKAAPAATLAAVTPPKATAPAPKPVDTTKKRPSATGSLFGDVIDGVYKKENNVNVQVIPYPYVRQADVMWSKRIWREIDVREKINRPLNHPNSRLINVIMKAITAGELTAYRNPDDGSDSTFRDIMSVEQVANLAGGRADTIQIPDMIDPSIMRDTVVRENFNPDQIVKYRVKEDWIFDKQRSIFEPRIIGIAPCKLNISKTSGDTIGVTPIFWVYYPEARQVFANSEMFNRFNDASNLSFDDFFIKRLFTSYITKESNSEDLRIEDYAKGIDKLYEGDRIKKKLMDYEQDLWEY